MSIIATLIVTKSIITKSIAGRRGALRAMFAVVLAALSLSWALAPARAAEAIKIGFSMALTGGVAPNGKMLLAALEIWRDDVNAKVILWPPEYKTGDVIYPYEKAKKK